MTALQKIKRKHIHLSALTILTAAFLAILVLAIISLRQYFFLGTNLSLSFVGQDAVLRFNLDNNNKTNLTSLAKSLNLDWQGQDLSIELTSDDVAKWKSLLPSSAHITFPDQSQMILHATTTNLPLGPIAHTDSINKFIPHDAVAIVSSQGLEKGYALPGKDVFTEISGRPTLAAFYVQNKLSLAFICSVKDQAALNAKLANLSNNSGTPVLGYSSEEGVPVGFGETDVDGIKTYVLTDPALKYQPTFGNVGGYLLVASSPDAWQAAENAFNSGNNLGKNAKYQEALSSAPKFSSGFAYLDLTALAGRGQKITGDLSPFADLSIDDSWFLSGINAGNLDSFTAAWFGLTPGGQGQSSLWVRVKSK